MWESNAGAAMRRGIFSKSDPPAREPSEWIPLMDCGFDVNEYWPRVAQVSLEVVLRRTPDQHRKLARCGPPSFGVYIVIGQIPLIELYLNSAFLPCAALRAILRYQKLFDYIRIATGNLCRHQVVWDLRPTGNGGISRNRLFHIRVEFRRSADRSIHMPDTEALYWRPTRLYRVQSRQSQRMARAAPRRGPSTSHWTLVTFMIHDRFSDLSFGCKRYPRRSPSQRN